MDGVVRPGRTMTASSSASAGGPDDCDPPPLKIAATDAPSPQQGGGPGARTPTPQGGGVFSPAPPGLNHTTAGVVVKSMVGEGVGGLSGVGLVGSLVGVGGAGAGGGDENGLLLSQRQNCLPINLKISPVRPRSSTTGSSSPPPAGLSSSLGRAGGGPGVDQEPLGVAGRLKETFEAADGSSSIMLEETTRSLAQFYCSQSGADRAAFLRTLASEYGSDHVLVEHLASRMSSAIARAGKVEGQIFRIEDRLRVALVPRYHNLFVQFSRLDGGIAFLVNLRADIITLVRAPGVDQDSASLQAMNSTLHGLLSLWLSPGSLQLERITWRSPCDLLQKISAYEAVTPIRNWADLRRKVGPYRRCFAFTHPCLPCEPVVVVHTALAPNISRSLQSFAGDKTGGLFSDSEFDESGKEDVKSIRAAIFYSITSTQKGLQGVELGNNLIKRIIVKLTQDFPQMQEFSSLSPIPGFRDWLLEEIGNYVRLQQMGEHPSQQLLTDREIADISGVFGSFENSVFELLREVLRSDRWVEQPHLTSILSGPFMRLCARYLYLEKKRGYAVNPVANFHLRNGAVIWRLNWMSDTSPRGLSGSCSIMANYRYYPDQAEENMRSYVHRQVIPASDQILELVGSAATAVAAPR